MRVFTSPSQPTVMQCQWHSCNALCVTGWKLARNNTDEDIKFNFDTENIQFDLSSISDLLVFNLMYDFVYAK